MKRRSFGTIVQNNLVLGIKVIMLRQAIDFAKVSCVGAFIGLTATVAGHAAATRMPKSVSDAVLAVLKSVEPKESRKYHNDR
jgi:hypothetical protein